MQSPKSPPILVLLIVLALNFSEPLVAALPKSSPVAGADGNAPAAGQSAVNDPKPGAEPEIVLSGFVIKRANGGFLTFTVENSAFVLSFFDAKKKPVAPDVARAVVRYESNNYRVRIPVQPLHASGENSMASAPGIKAPYVYKIFLSLFEGDAAEPTESYNFAVNLSV